MVKRPLKYPRDELIPLSRPGTGAFFDFAAKVMRRHAAKLESYSLARRL